MILCEICKKPMALAPGIDYYCAECPIDWKAELLPLDVYDSTEEDTLA
jgi:hypothetical protein